MKERRIVIGKNFDTPKTLVCVPSGYGIDVHICKNNYIEEGFNEIDDEMIEGEIAVIHFSNRSSMRDAMLVFSNILDNWEKINPKGE